jgi:glycosyltransferase involved in cell wall biosynthesis
VDSLVRHASVVLFSAAIPDQGGTAHLNEQWPSYWAELFARRGYQAYDAIRPAVWDDQQVAWWYRQNILVFADAQARGAHPALAAASPAPGAALDRVHPENYAAKARGWQAAAGQLSQLQTFLARDPSFEVTRSAAGQVTINRRPQAGADVQPASARPSPHAGTNPDSKSPLLSLVIPARNSAGETSACLASVLYSVTKLGLNCELVLLDDASAREEKLLEIFLQHKPAATQHSFVIARSNKHQHYTGVFSIGLYLARGENVVFISNDMLVTPSFLTALLGVAALRSEFGIVRGTSNYVDSHPEHMVALPQDARTYSDMERFSQTMFERNGLRHTEDHVLSGDAVLVKRSVIDRIGVMDLRFFGYFGDIDFGMRAHNAGFKLVCAKGAWLFHKGAGHISADKSGRDAAFAHRMALVETAFQTFREKWDRNLPGSYGELKTFDFLDLAGMKANEVPLKYQLPPAVLNDLQFF